MPTAIPPEEQKALMKEALKEWMDDQFATFGKWSAGALLSVLVGGLAWFSIWMAGWHR